MAKSVVQRWCWRAAAAVLNRVAPDRLRRCGRAEDDGAGSPSALPTAERREAGSADDRAVRNASNDAHQSRSIDAVNAALMNCWETTSTTSRRFPTTASSSNRPFLRGRPPPVSQKRQHEQTSLQAEPLIERPHPVCVIIMVTTKNGNTAAASAAWSFSDCEAKLPTFHNMKITPNCEGGTSGGLAIPPRSLPCERPQSETHQMIRSRDSPGLRTAAPPSRGEVHFSVNETPWDPCLSTSTAMRSPSGWRTSPWPSYRARGVVPSGKIADGCASSVLISYFSRSAAILSPSLPIAPRAPTVAPARARQAPAQLHPQRTRRTRRRGTSTLSLLDELTNALIR